MSRLPPPQFSALQNPPTDRSVLEERFQGVKRFHLLALPIHHPPMGAGWQCGGILTWEKVNQKICPPKWCLVSWWWIPWDRTRKKFTEKNKSKKTTSKMIYLVVEPTHLKNIRQIGSFPQEGVNMKNIWNHHPGNVVGCCLGMSCLRSSIQVTNFNQLRFRTVTLHSCTLT